MTPEAITAYTALVVAGGSFIIAVWGTSWSARSKLADLEKTNSREVAELEDKFSDSVTAKMDSHKRMVGETLTAMSTKIGEVEKNLTKVELWNRDNFVRRVEFTEAIAAIRGDFNSLAGRMDRKLDSIDDKLDGLIVAERRSA